MRKIIRFCARCIRAILKSFYFLFPVKKNKVLFINFNGKGYGCNPKYIAEEIIKQNLGYDLVWLVEDIHTPLPKEIRAVKYKSLKAYYELATTKVIVVNVKNDLRLYKKKKQYIIQTWHGSYSSKLLESAAKKLLSPDYIKESMHNSDQTDLFLSNGKITSDCYRRDFWCACEIMECGFPRNDPLFHLDLKVEEKVRAWFQLEKDCKIALYAPTFRDDSSTECYQLDAERTVQALSFRGEKWKLLIRMHPNVAKDASLFVYTENVLDGTSYPDMQELLQACDVLITDYSSSIYEAAVMGKGVYIYATDVEKYEETRGLTPEFYNMPYVINRTQEMLETAIKADSVEDMKIRAKEFLNGLGCVDDGNASKRVVRRMRQVIQGELQKAK